jgi:hypothetical protein
MEFDLWNVSSLCQIINARVGKHIGFDMRLNVIDIRLEIACVYIVTESILHK